MQAENLQKIRYVIWVIINRKAVCIVVWEYVRDVNAAKWSMEIEVIVHVKN